MAKDIIHEPVKRALIKDGWTITDDPFELEYEDVKLYVDLAAERSTIAAIRNDQKILVEVKSFVGHSFMRDFQQALGQWLIYTDLKNIVAAEYELYLALSDWVYMKYFEDTKAVQYLVRKNRINLIVVDIQSEEVITWINWHSINP